MHVRDVVAVLEGIAPTRFAEPWDNVGLLLGDPSASVSRVLLAIDCTEAVADEARARGAELIVAYHPPIFQPLKRVTAPGLVFSAIRDGLAIFSPHTALDVAPGGTNDVLGDVVGLVTRAPLRTQPPKGGEPLPPGFGMGRIGDVEPTTRAALIERIKSGLGVSHALVAGPTAGDVRRVAVCAGSCGDLYRDALAAGADVFLTGELRHHDALAAAAAGMTVVCALHSNSERVALEALAQRLRGSAIIVDRSERDRDPFAIL
ncbi:Nif3-like dinuclear metal center hexameric protein [Pendulispora brunnea]|uniref:Nif3-like dinuclear metal center hexameric protein n=1 Tax=Pendulispora brunnea TaxID=2905690 RepID=A0ABZ2KEL8_9BACT